MGGRGRLKWEVVGGQIGRLKLEAVRGSARQCEAMGGRSGRSCEAMGKPKSEAVLPDWLRQIRSDHSVRP